MSGSRGVISAQVRAPPSRVPRRRALQTSCLVRSLALVPAASRRPATPKHRTLLARSPSRATDVVSCAQSLLAGFPVDAGERPPRGCARRSLAGETISSPAAGHRCHAQPPAPVAPAPRAPPSLTPRPPNSPGKTRLAGERPRPSCARRIRAV